MCSRSAPSLPGSAVLSFQLYSPTPHLLSAKNDENIPLRGSFQHATAVPPNPEERPGYQPQARTTTQPEQQRQRGGTATSEKQERCRSEQSRRLQTLYASSSPLVTPGEETNAGRLTAATPLPPPDGNTQGASASIR